MPSRKAIFRCLLTCLMTGLVLIQTGCAQMYLPQAGLAYDPANETQSALATLAAAPASPQPSSLTPSPTAASTPLPTEPPPTATSNAPLACAASDLLINVRSDITGNFMAFNVSLDNAANHTCLLIQPPKASLVTRQGAALDVNVNPGCTECVPKSPIPQNAATRTALAPTQTAAAQSPGSNELSLGPNQTAGVILRWENWCEPFPPGGVSIQLDLGNGGTLTLPTDAQKAGTCTTPGQPSVLTVSPFFIHD